MAERENGQPDRVDYRVAGAAQRAATHRARRHRLTSTDRRVLLGAFNLTTTYSKVADWVHIDQVAAEAGVHRADAGKSLRKLDRLGILGWESSQGRRGKSLLSVPLETPNLGETVTSSDLGDTSTSSEANLGHSLEGDVYLNTEKKDREESIGLPAAAGPSKVDRLKTIAAVAALDAAAADTNDEKNESSPYEHVIDPNLAVGAQAVGGAAGADEADRIDDADRGVGRDVDDQGPGIDPAPMPTELATALGQLRGDVNESTKVQAAELYAINAGAILTKIEEARGAHKPGAYLTAAFRGMIAGNELEAPIDTPAAAGAAPRDPGRIENNARAAIARLRPDYPLDDLRDEIVKEFKSLDEATVDELLAEDPQPLDERTDERAVDDQGIRFVDLPAEIRARALRTTETYEELADDEKAELDRLEHEYAQAITEDSDIN